MRAFVRSWRAFREQKMTDSITCGVHHVGLAVPDLEAAELFFRDTLGWQLVGSVPDYPAVFVSDGSVMVTLWRVADPQHATAFDRRENVGLHHLALAVPDDPALAETYRRVRAHPGVTIEFEPQPIRVGSAMRHFICAMPGGVRIEFATRSG
jgi:catechol 2,3-dioxygenase-like lactoylglutathione lyase family enzyme